LTNDPLDPKTQTWRRDDAHLLGQILNSMEPRVQDLILIVELLKKWTYLDSLYLGDSNLSRAYDVI